jgi:hypothetical protein
MKMRITPLSLVGLLIILGVNAELLFATMTGIVSDNSAAADKVDWQPSLRASTGSAANRKPIEGYQQILARPVFFKSREPYVPPPPPPPPAPPPAVIMPPPPVVIDPGLVLGGIMIKNDVRKAFVFSRAGADGSWTAEGEEFMGWKVRSINGTGAKLEQQGRSIELQLYPPQ